MANNNKASAALLSLKAIVENNADELRAQLQELVEDVEGRTVIHTHVVLDKNQKQLIKDLQKQLSAIGKAFGSDFIKIDDTGLAEFGKEAEEIANNFKEALKKISEGTLSVSGEITQAVKKGVDFSDATKAVQKQIEQNKELASSYEQIVTKQKDVYEVDVASGLKDDKLKDKITSYLRLFDSLKSNLGALTNIPGISDQEKDAIRATEQYKALEAQIALVAKTIQELRASYYDPNQQYGGKKSLLSKFKTNEINTYASSAQSAMSKLSEGFNHAADNASDLEQVLQRISSLTRAIYTSNGYQAVTKTNKDGKRITTWEKGGGHATDSGRRIKEYQDTLAFIQNVEDKSYELTARTSGNKQEALKRLDGLLEQFRFIQKDLEGAFDAKTGAFNGSKDLFGVEQSRAKLEALAKQILNLQKITGKNGAAAIGLAEQQQIETLASGNAIQGIKNALSDLMGNGIVQRLINQLAVLNSTMNILKGAFKATTDGGQSPFDNLVENMYKVQRILSEGFKFTVDTSQADEATEQVGKKTITVNIDPLVDTDQFKADLQQQLKGKIKATVEIEPEITHDSKSKFLSGAEKAAWYQEKSSLRNGFTLYEKDADGKDVAVEVGASLSERRKYLKDRKKQLKEENKELAKIKNVRKGLSEDNYTEAEWAQKDKYDKAQLQLEKNLQIIKELDEAIQDPNLMFNWAHEFDLTTEEIQVLSDSLVQLQKQLGENWSPSKGFEKVFTLFRAIQNGDEKLIGASGDAFKTQKSYGSVLLAGMTGQDVTGKKSDRVALAKGYKSAQEAQAIEERAAKERARLAEQQAQANAEIDRQVDTIFKIVEAEETEEEKLQRHIDLLEDIRSENEHILETKKNILKYDEDDLEDANENDLTKAQQRIKANVEEMREEYSSFIITLKDGSRIDLLNEETLEGFAFLEGSVKTDPLSKIASVSMSYTDDILKEQDFEKAYDLAINRLGIMEEMSSIITHLKSGQDLDGYDSFAQSMISNYGLAEEKANELQKVFMDLDGLWDKYGIDNFEDATPAFYEEFNLIREAAIPLFEEIGQIAALSVRRFMDQYKESLSEEDLHALDFTGELARSKNASDLDFTEYMRSNEEVEASDVSKLKTVLENDIPAAVERKNEAFRGEVEVVRQAVLDEEGALNEIITTLHSIIGWIDQVTDAFKTIKDLNVNLDIKGLDNIQQVKEFIGDLETKLNGEKIPVEIEPSQESLNDFVPSIQRTVGGKEPVKVPVKPDLGENEDLTELAQVLKDIVDSNIAEIAAGIDQISEGLEKKEGSDTIIKDLKAFRDIVDKDADKIKTGVTNITAAFSELKAGLEQLSLGEESKTFLSQIDAILEKGEHLKDLATVLRAPAKKVADAAKVAGTNDDDLVIEEPKKTKTQKTNEHYGALFEYVKAKTQLSKELARATNEERKKLIEEQIAGYDKQIEAEKELIANENLSNEKQDAKLKILEDQYERQKLLNDEIAQKLKDQEAYQTSQRVDLAEQLESEEALKELGDLSDEWNKALKAAYSYQEVLGSIVDITRNIRRGADGNYYESYVITGKDGNKITKGKDGTYLLSSQQVGDDLTLYNEKRTQFKSKIKEARKANQLETDLRYLRENEDIVGGSYESRIGEQVGIGTKLREDLDKLVEYFKKLRELQQITEEEWTAVQQEMKEAFPEEVLVSADVLDKVAAAKKRKANKKTDTNSNKKKTVTREMTEVYATKMENASISYTNSLKELNQLEIEAINRGSSSEEEKKQLQEKREEVEALKVAYADLNKEYQKYKDILGALPNERETVTKARGRVKATEKTIKEEQSAARKAYNKQQKDAEKAAEKRDFENVTPEQAADALATELEKKLDKASNATDDLRKRVLEFIQLLRDHSNEDYFKNIVDTEDAQNRIKQMTNAVEGLERVLEKSSDANKTLKEMNEYINSTKYTNSIQDKIQAARDAFSTEYGEIGNRIISGDASQDEITKYSEAVNKLKLQWKDLKREANLDENLNANMITIDKLRAKVAKIIAENSKLQGTDLGGQFKNYQARLQSIAQAGQATRAATKEESAELQRLIASMEELGLSGDNAFTKLIKRISELNRSFIGMYFSIQDIIRYIRTAATTVTELDTAFTEMRKVSNESITSLKDYQDRTFDLATSVGTTALDLQNSTAEFMRLGQGLDEASQSALNATKLMNVSEFENISDATDALIAMKAAYDDLSQDEIIDKLNNIGNNFSISTSDLGTSLQRAASVLKTQGNDIDEAIALITAGNAVTRDSDMTAAGVRTISLRIAGTEEAKQELADIGEEVEDYVVMTNAKKREIIRDYTAVASNNGQGVDILDNNGNLKNTYEILLEISKVYKEIQEEDKKFGTDRASALIEELAGKNRSQIAASILMNGDLLESVYKSSQNSEGSAQEELNKYLDSIQGRVSLFQNELQRIIKDTLDSDLVKEVVDLGTEGLKTVDQFAKIVGPLLELIVNPLIEILDLVNQIISTLGPLGTTGLMGAIFGGKKFLGRDKKLSLFLL